MRACSSPTSIAAPRSANSARSGSRASTPPRASTGSRTRRSCRASSGPRSRSTARSSPTSPCATAGASPQLAEVAKQAQRGSERRAELAASASAPCAPSGSRRSRAEPPRPRRWTRCASRFLGRKGDADRHPARAQGPRPRGRARRRRRGEPPQGRARSAARRARGALEDAAEAARRRLDVTLPGRRPWVGHRHVLNAVEDELLDIFHGLGLHGRHGPRGRGRPPQLHRAQPAAGPSRARRARHLLLSTATRAAHPHLAVLGARDGAGASRRCAWCSPAASTAPRPVDATHMDQFHQIDGLYVDRAA